MFADPISGMSDSLGVHMIERLESHQLDKLDISKTLDSIFGYYSIIHTDELTHVMI